MELMRVRLYSHAMNANWIQLAGPLLKNKDEHTTWFKSLENYYSLYLHGLKEVEFMDKLEVYNMELRGGQDDPSDLNADP